MDPPLHCLSVSKTFKHAIIAECRNTIPKPGSAEDEPYIIFHTVRGFSEPGDLCNFPHVLNPVIVSPYCQVVLYSIPLKEYISFKGGGGVSVELSLYMKYQMDPVTFMWFISTYLVPENNFYFEHLSKYAS